jgi:hypothetical protein
MEDLVGKQFVAFKFKSTNDLSFVDSMKKFIGETGTIVKADEKICRIQFPSSVDKFRIKWCYPTDKVLENLVDKKVQLDKTEEKPIKLIIEEVKSKIKDINNM